jgi:hypothetical protein
MQILHQLLIKASLIIATGRAIVNMGNMMENTFEFGIRIKSFNLNGQQGAREHTMESCHKPNPHKSTWCQQVGGLNQTEGSGNKTVLTG